MAKKDFSKVSETITQTTQEELITQETQEEQPKKGRKTYTEAEALELLNQIKGGGHKGVKLPRINLALTADNYLYVKTCSRAAGITYAEMINQAIDDHRQKNADTYKQILEFRGLIK